MHSARIIITCRVLLSLVTAISLSLSSNTALAQEVADFTRKPAAPEVMAFNFHPIDVIGADSGWGYSVRVLADQTVIYVGKGRVKTPGEHSYYLPTARFQALTDAFEKADFMRMSSPVGATTETILSISYSMNGVTRKISAGDPDHLWTNRLVVLLSAINQHLELNKLVCPIVVADEKFRDTESCEAVQKRIQRAYVVGKFQ